MVHYITAASLSLSGNTASGSAIISSIASTIGIVDGSFLTVSKGFPSTKTHYKILSHTTTTVTVDTNATSTESSATVVQQADITDKVVQDFVTDAIVENWLDSVDNEMLALAAEHNLTDEEIHSPLNPIVREYLIMYFNYLVMRDNIGGTNPESPEQEKYRVKFDIFAKECERMRLRCTEEIIEESDDDIVPAIDRVPDSGWLIRG